MVTLSSEAACLKSAEYALTLLCGGNVSKASEELAKVKREAISLQEHCQKHAKRLEDLEPWSKRQQENHQRQIGQVEQQQTNLESRLNDLNVEIAKIKGNISYYNSRISEKESKIDRAKAQKGGMVAGAVTTGVIGAIFAPFTFGISLVPAAVGTTSFAVAASALESEISDLRQERGNLESKVSALESDTNDVKRQKQRGQDELNSLKSKQKHMYEELRSMKTAIAMLMKSGHFWEKLKLATEDLDQNGAGLKRLVDRAAKDGNLSLINRTGTQTRVRKFGESCLEVDDKMSDCEEIVISYNFVCCKCHQNKTGLPWAYGAYDVVCDNCH